MKPKATSRNMSAPAHPGLRTLAVVLTWIDIKNAEYEVVHRLRRAAQNIGLDIIIIDNEGYKLWSTTEGRTTERSRITSRDCDFVISLHFESPKLYDIFSYVALWNPPEFYVGPGYDRTISSIASHDAVLSCGSVIADAHARNVFAGFGRPLEANLPSLFHSVPEPHFEPSAHETSRLFYIGINWERINGERGRHHDLFELLDAQDLIDIYGPRVFLNKEPWAGFACYRGEIPFDGESVVKRIHESGICLALSSDAHQRCGIMSNRLFEGLAAGAVIIANQNPFISRYFSDCVHIIDDKGSPQALADDVRNLVMQIRKDPDAARQRALLAQHRFKEMFTLEGSLRALIAQHDQRMAVLREKSSSAAARAVTVLIEYAGLNFSTLLEMLTVARSQRDCRLDLVVVCDKRLEKQLTLEIIEQYAGFANSFRILSDDLTLISDDLDADVRRWKMTGSLLARALFDLKTPFFCFLHPDDFWFADHLSSLTSCLVASKDSVFACSGKITEDEAEDGLTTRQLEELRFDRFADLVYCSLNNEAGRFLYRSVLLDALQEPVILLLDGFHNRYCNLEALLRGVLSQSGRPSYVHRRWKSHHIQMVYPEAQQTLFVLDSYRGDPRWLERAALMPVALPDVPAAPILKDGRPLAEPGIFYELTTDGEGLPFIRRGFSVPEDRFIWIDGRHARLEFQVESPIVGHDILLLAGARMADDERTQLVSVSINGRRTAMRPVGEDLEELRFPIPEALGQTQRVSIMLTLRHADQVRDASGATVDSRHLGLRVAGIGIFPVVEDVVEPVEAAVKPSGDVAVLVEQAATEPAEDGPITDPEAGKSPGDRQVPAEDAIDPVEQAAVEDIMLQPVEYATPGAGEVTTPAGEAGVPGEQPAASAEVASSNIVMKSGPIRRTLASIPGARRAKRALVNRLAQM